MKLNGPILVRLILYSILIVMALMIRHRLQNRPPPPPTGPFEVTIEPEPAPASPATKE